MQVAVITDGVYRSALTAARALGRAGYQVVVTQTRAECAKEPPVFSSKYAQGVWIEGSCGDEDYVNRLVALLREYERPVLLCVGAVSLSAVAAQRQRLAAVCDFLVAPLEVLEALNDKEVVHRRAEALGLPVPREYSSLPERYPVVIKPRCGEKFGLKAAERYAVAHDEAEYRAALARMARYDPAPIVQEQVAGPGFGVSLLLDGDGRTVCAICHRRVREYPYSGGPSTCCVSEYDLEKIKVAETLLRSFGFVGIAMVEFKGDNILEVNPRIWGSFPLTEVCGCPFTLRYAQTAAGRTTEPVNYRTGVKTRFFFNDLAATLDCFRHGAIRRGFSGLADFFRCREALKDRDDPRPYRRYLRSYLTR